MSIDQSILRERVKREVNFEFCQGGSLYYRCYDSFRFEVPVTDLGSATVGAREKGATLMRWIRKTMESEARLREEARAELKASV